jgi:hypothetical protein
MYPIYDVYRRIRPPRQRTTLELIQEEYIRPLLEEIEYQNELLNANNAPDNILMIDHQQRVLRQYANTLMDEHFPRYMNIFNQFVIRERLVDF